MLPHRIRLRGPWNLVSLVEPGESRIVRLPENWCELGVGVFRFSRHFGGLPRLDAHERCWILLSDATGVCSIALNEHALNAAGENREMEFDVTQHLHDRNTLSIEAATDGAKPAWSECQLEIRGQVWLSNLIAMRYGNNLILRGTTRGTADDALDLYAILDRQTVLTASIRPEHDRRAFEFTSAAVDSAEWPLSVRVELIRGSAIWHAADVPLTGS